MGGHSHWSTIKRHKGAQDAKRGKIFTRVIREISIAARNGGDPDGNPALRQAIAKSKEVNMPADTVKRAIQRGTGELPGVHFEEFMLEGYGPGGTALLLEVSTDKRNRTVAEVRNILTKHNGTMAEPGAVAWQFHKKGLLVIENPTVTEEQLFELALEAGAEDVKQTSTGFDVISEPADFEAVKEAIQKAQIEVSLSEITYLPANNIQLEDKDAERALKLMDLLDENEDVAKVYANFEISDELMEKMADEGA